MCVHTRVHSCMHMNVWKCVHAYVLHCVCECVCTCVCLYVSVYLHVCVHLYVQFSVCVCVHLCVMYFLFLVLWKYAKIILPLFVIILADLEVEIEIFSKEKWGHKIVSNLLNYFFESFCNLWIASFAAMSWLLSICFSQNSHYWVYMTYNASFYVHTHGSLWHIFMSR